MVNAASFAAIAAYLCGGRLTLWEKAETTRDAHAQTGFAPQLCIIEGKKDLSCRGKHKAIEKVERIT